MSRFPLLKFSINFESLDFSQYKFEKDRECSEFEGVERGGERVGYRDNTGIPELGFSLTLIVVVLVALSPVQHAEYFENIRIA